VKQKGAYLGKMLFACWGWMAGVAVGVVVSGACVVTFAPVCAVLVVVNALRGEPLQ